MDVIGEKTASGGLSVGESSDVRAVGGAFFIGRGEHSMATPLVSHPPRKREDKWEKVGEFSAGAERQDGRRVDDQVKICPAVNYGGCGHGKALIGQAYIFKVPPGKKFKWNSAVRHTIHGEHFRLVNSYIIFL